LARCPAALEWTGFAAFRLPIFGPQRATGQLRADPADHREITFSVSVCSLLYSETNAAFLGLAAW